MLRTLNREEIEHVIALRYVGAMDLKWNDDGSVSLKYSKTRDYSKMMQMEKDLSELSTSSMMQQGAINFAHNVIMDLGGVIPMDNLMGGKEGFGGDIGPI